MIIYLGINRIAEELDELFPGLVDSKPLRELLTVNIERGIIDPEDAGRFVLEVIQLISDIDPAWREELSSPRLQLKVTKIIVVYDVVGQVFSSVTKGLQMGNFVVRDKTEILESLRELKLPDHRIDDLIRNLSSKQNPYDGIAYYLKQWVQGSLAKNWLANVAFRRNLREIPGIFMTASEEEMAKLVKSFLAEDPMRDY